MPVRALAVFGSGRLPGGQRFAHGIDYFIPFLECAQCSLKLEFVLQRRYFNPGLEL